MKHGSASEEGLQNQVTQPFFMKRVLTLWIFTLVCYWFAKGMLFNDLLANMRLVFFPSAEYQRGWAIASDLILSNALILLFFVPQSKWLAATAAFMLGCLLFVMAVGARGIYAAPVGWWILLAFLAGSDKTFVIFWKCVRWITLAGTVLYGTLLGTEPATLELAYFTDFHRPNTIYFVFCCFAIGFFTRKLDGLFLAILLFFALFHAIKYQQPFWPKTLIFAPFLNWTNLHRFFTTRFEPK